ncbi:MAG: CsgG/HfaB family protein [Planctomycetota bacterium]
MKLTIRTASRALTLSVGAAALLAGCQSTSESAGSQTLATNVGVYSPPPPGIDRPRVAVPAMQMGGAASAGMEGIAADQLATLLVRTDRFDVIERSQLQALLDEQNLAGVVADGEVAAAAQVRGVDYLVLGKVTNLRVKETRSGQQSGFGNIINIATDEVSGGIGGFDVDSSKVEVKVECGVDLRVVDPATGSTLDATFSEYTRTDKASALGIQVLGVGANSEADIQISDDDRGLVLRLALDDAVRKMLPTLDRKLLQRSRDLEASADA